MDTFSSSYEKLIDMGFAADEIDNAIQKGFYTFDKILNELVDVEHARINRVESYDESHVGCPSYPVLKLRSSVLITGDESIWADDKKGSQDNSDVSDYKDLFSHLSIDENNVFVDIEDSSHSTNTIRIDTAARSTQIGDNSVGSTDSKPIHHKQSAITNLSKGAATSTFSSSLLSTSTQEPNRKMTKIQIMDLLDPNYEPMTFNNSFVSSICTVRDLICWFHQSRQSLHRVSCHSKQESLYKSRFSIPSETDLYTLINRFQHLKWHLVLPSGAQSMRICGSDFLDKTLDSLGLEPSAHLLAIVSCPLELSHQSTDKSDSCSSQFSSMTLIESNRNQSSSVEPTPELCTVSVKMINYRHNPLYVQGRTTFVQSYDAHQTTLQRVAEDFLAFCQIDMSSFMLLDLHNRTQFSDPEDYLRTLSELGLAAGSRTTLYCHVPESTDSLVTIDTFHAPAPSPPDSSSPPTPVRPFSGIGIALSSANTHGYPKLPVTSSKQPSHMHPVPLAQLSLNQIYNSLTIFNGFVCRSVRKLPNHILQSLIKRLLAHQLLSAPLLTFFCAPGTCLTSLDLSYSLAATNEVLKSVGRCTSLQELILDNDQHVFSNEGLWHVRHCLSLQRLSLNQCGRVNDWGIQVVAALPALAVLAIKNTAVTNLGIKHVHSHLTSGVTPIAPSDPHLIPPSSSQVSSIEPALRSVDLSGLAISNDSLPCLSLFSRLELLNLSSTHIADPSLLPYLPMLRHLDISHCHELVWDRRAHIRALAERFPRLTSINVRGISNSNLVHVTMALAHCLHLRQIDGIFCHAQMTASLVASLSHLPLQTIILTNCRHVTDLWLPVLTRFSATLTHLVLSSCPALTGSNGYLVNNLSRLTNLSWLDLSHLDNVAASHIIELITTKNRFPKMQVVWISLTEAEETEFRLIANDLHFKVNVTRSLINPIQVKLALTAS